MKFKFSLQKGDIVKFTKDGEENLGIIRGISAGEVTFCSITDARKKDDMIKSKCWNRPSPSSLFKLKMQKYNMNVFGELQIAND